jgi:hypothetical protein
VNLDGLFRLVGDEDCGVGIDCLKCDRGGAPVAYYQHPTGWFGYDGTDVVRVHTIADLLAAAERHADSVHHEVRP